MTAATSWRHRVRAVAAQRLGANWPVVLLSIATLSLAFGVASLDTYPIGAAIDDAYYVMLGKSIATGQGYRSLNVPGAPPNAHFPPGYPAALSLIWRAFPEFPGNVIFFRSFNILCLAIAAVGSARFLASRNMGRDWAAALGVLSAASVPLLVLGAMLLSEPFFLALLMLLLPALERFAESPDDSRTGVAHAIALGIAIALCTLVRTHGIVLIPAMAIVLGVRRRWRDMALVVAVAIACLLPWQLWTASYANALPGPLRGGYESYTAWWIRGLREIGWEMVPLTLGKTFAEAGQIFGALFSPVRGTVGHFVTFFALAIVAGAGVVGSWRRIPVTLLFMGGYLSIVAIWPFQPGRFIWGVWPLLLMLLVLGARAAVRARGSWAVPVRVTVLVAACWTSVGYAAYEARGIRGRWWSSIPRAGASHISFAVEWTLANSAPSDIVATEDEGPVFLYTGRRTVPVRAFTVRQYLAPASTEIEAKEGLLPVLAAYPVHAVVVYTPTGRAIAQLLSQPPNPILTLRANFPGGAALTVLRP